MKNITLEHGLDWLMAILSFLGALAVLQTFIVGKHFIIPTLLLSVTIFIANLAWYGLKGTRWAQVVNFWCGVLLTSHGFFALFWAKKYREILGEWFEPTAIVVILLLFMLTWFYARSNRIFAGK